MTITDRLYEIDARVTQLVILPLMDGSDAAEDLLKDCWHQLPELLQFDEDVIKYFNNYQICDYNSACEFLKDCEYTGVFFAVEADIYKNDMDELEGKYENLVSMYRFTGRRAVEYGYAESLGSLEEAVNKALDKLAPQLFED